MRENSKRFLTNKVKIIVNGFISFLILSSLYASGFIATHRAVILQSFIFSVSMIYFLILIFMQLRNNERLAREYNKQYDRIQTMIKQMRCFVLEYDIKSGRMESDEYFEKIFGYHVNDNFIEWTKKHKQYHPEFDYDGLICELKYAIEYKVTTSFETTYREDEVKFKMLSIIMMPMINEDGVVGKVLLSIRETSDEHTELQNMLDMYNQIPGGTYRYYLGSPNCLEYAGVNLCKMLGYTVEEFYEVVKKKYYKVIAEQDQEKYKNFLKSAAESTGVRSCQYSIKCKNGDVLDVLDTMEIIENSSGVKYGYSVVVDITEYVKKQKIVRQEYKQLEQNLEMMRIQNSASQMQPHFLYNALSSIREVILIEPEYASDIICDFTAYLRACIRTMQHGDLISIKQEISNIQAYVNIEKMRMGKRLKVIYDIESEDFKIVPLSIQPLVENAIRHGIYPKGRKGGTIIVKIRTYRNYNIITIKDNGVGFDYQKVRDEVEQGKRDSIGLDNVMYRLNKRLQARVTIKSKIGEGTVISVSVQREGESNESNTC